MRVVCTVFVCYVFSKCAKICTNKQLGGNFGRLENRG